MNNFIVALIAMPVFCILIGWVYIVQYKSSRQAWRPLFVMIHFISVSGIIGAYFYLCLENYVPSLWQYPGWFLFVVGGLIFWYAAFRHKASLFPKDNYQVFSKGPYKYIRHPIYAGGLLAAAGLILVAPSLHVVVVWSILFLSLWILSIIEERELLLRLGDQYKSYLNQTKRIIPWVL